MILSNEQTLAMKVAAMPLMVWLCENCHPHVKAIVDSELVEIMEGLATERRVEIYDKHGNRL